MKIAPEHTSDEVLHHIGKTGKQSLIEFKRMFDELNKETGKKQFYILSNCCSSRCKDSHMHELKQFTTMNSK